MWLCVCVGMPSMWLFVFQHVNLVFLLCSWNNDNQSLLSLSRNSFTGYEPSAYPLNRNDIPFQQI